MRILRVAIVIVAIAALICSTLPVEVKAPILPPTIVQLNNPSPTANGQFGKSIGYLGDNDGDLIPDFAVGAPGQNKVYIMSGAAPNNIIRTISDPDDCTEFWFGHCVRGIGDIDGDFIEDIAVGSPSDPLALYPTPPPPLPDGPPIDPKYFRSTGRVFVFSGASGAKLLEIRIYNDYWKDPEIPFCLGWAIAPLGDINGDGKSDFAISDPVLDSLPGLPEARVYAISGADGSVLWKTSEPQTALGKQRMPSFGYFLADIGDVTGDGKQDLLVSAPFAELEPKSESYCFVGIGWVLNGATGTVIVGYAKHGTRVDNDRFSQGLGNIGDQDGDGTSDYAFGASGSSEVEAYSGETKATLLICPAPAGSKSFGWAFAKVWDVDLDGRDDFWVSAPEAGKVFLLNINGDVLVEVDDPSPSASSWLGFGHSMSFTRDLNGDHAPDLIVGKPSQSVGGFDKAGAVFLVLGVRGVHTSLKISKDLLHDSSGFWWIKSTIILTLDLNYTRIGSAALTTSYRISNSTYDTGYITAEPPISFQLAGLSDGIYQIHYYSTNNLGNAESINAETFILDNTPPTVTETNFENTALQDGVTFEISTWDLTKAASATFSIRSPEGNVLSPEFENMPAAPANDGKWKLSFETRQLPDGFYSLVTNATDMLGNSGLTPIPFSIRNWVSGELLPSSESNKAGRTMPIKFSIRIAANVDTDQPFVRNEELIIKIYAKGDPGSILQTSTYGTTSRDYRIDPKGELYIVNFRTQTTPKTYVVKICRNGMLIGTFEFQTVK